MRYEQIEWCVGILLIAAVAVTFGYQLYLFISVNRRGSRNRRAPEITTRATVAAIRTTSENISFFNKYSHASGEVFYVTFYADVGGEIELYTDGDHAYLMHEGDSGELTYQGTRLCGFIPEGQ